MTELLFKLETLFLFTGEIVLALVLCAVLLQAFIYLDKFFKVDG